MNIPLFFPEQKSAKIIGMEKIESYLLLAKLGCPVFKSALLFPDCQITESLVEELYQYFGTDKITIRYQYIVPNSRPIQGGNRYDLTLENLSNNLHEGTAMWILEPIDRLTNEYGINIQFHQDMYQIEIVGKGFDVSDLNRGQVSPHEIIQGDLPIRRGVYDEWWKFMRFFFASQTNYSLSKKNRLNKLEAFGLIATEQIFDDMYYPLPYERLDELLAYIERIYDSVECEDYNVSCSIRSNKFIFWDIQTQEGKLKIYGI